jgi:thiol-disulfide isomerase/thioredoxin
VNKLPRTSRGSLWSAAFLVVALVGGCHPSVKRGRPAPSDAGGFVSTRASAEPLDFTVRDLAGKAVRLRDWRGHPVIVDFWATWCPPCRKEIPELNEIYRRYQTEGLIVLGVSMDEVQGDGRKVVEPFIEEFKIAYPIAMGDKALVEKLELSSVPTALFVARDGRLFSRIEGAGPPGELARAAADLLKK